jgi:hypothetical protein
MQQNVHYVYHRFSRPRAMCIHGHARSDGYCLSSSAAAGPRSTRCHLDSLLDELAIDIKERWTV